MTKSLYNDVVLEREPQSPIGVRDKFIAEQKDSSGREQPERRTTELG